MTTTAHQDQTPPRLLDAPAVAEILGVSTKQVRRLAPELGAFKVGRLLRFDPRQIDNYIAERSRP